jgi:NAD(P)H dehydrogenase (quinone)
MIAVIGATGYLGRLVIEEPLERGVPAGEIAALTRTPEGIRDLAKRGVQVRRADYTQPATLLPALGGMDRLLLVSSSEVGQRAAQHRNVIDAALGSNETEPFARTGAKEGGGA